MKGSLLMLALLIGLGLSGSAVADGRYDSRRGRGRAPVVGIVTVPSTGLQRHLNQHFEPLNRVHDQVFGAFGPTIIHEHRFVVPNGSFHGHRDRRDYDFNRRSDHRPRHGRIGGREDIKRFLDSSLSD